MTRLNDYITRIDLSVLNDYVVINGDSVVYAKGEMIVQQGRLCRYISVVKSGYFKYVALNSKGHEIVTGFSFEGEVVTDYVRGFLFGEPALTTIVAGCEAEVVRASIEDVRRYIHERNPGFIADTSSKLLQEAYRRYLDLLVKTPAERFHELVNRYPDVTRCLPIQELASFLGVSRRQLHRIRKA
ncbi:MAG: Crp/Fnr family transcriptional regulator [Duncaniella sp.]|nr:Crp/Fnr family transcriptional regulator [Duncaniella sp.]